MRIGQGYSQEGTWDEISKNIKSSIALEFCKKSHSSTTVGNKVFRAYKRQDILEHWWIMVIRQLFSQKKMENA